MGWTGALITLSTVTLLLATGVIHTPATGLARTLFVVFAGLLAVTLASRLLRRS